MLLGAGVDLIEKERFEGWLSRPGVRRRFAPAELAYAEGFVGEARRREAVASAFAVKEAFFKAASALLGAYDADSPEELFWGVCLEHEFDGRPWLRVSEPWGELLRGLGARRFLVSISHDRSQVLAVVLITDGQEEDAAQAMQRLVPTGFAPLAEPAGDILRVDGALAAGWLPRRARAAHKGDFGHVLVVGGSARYVGAPKLAAEAALRGGAGLVTLAAPEHIYPLSPEIMRLPLPTAGGWLRSGAISPLQKFVQGKVLILGMGLGREPETCLLVRRLAMADMPKVIDADGLFALAEMAAQADNKQINLPDNAVLTPHTGEMARLLDCTAAEVEADRLAAVRQCAAKYHAVVVLKGPDSLICGPEDEPVYVNTTGNPGMATGGSGDVLAGLIGAWLGQGLAAGLSVREATALAVFLHGLAGDLAAAAKSEYAMTAMDIVAHLPEAYKTLLA